MKLGEGDRKTERERKEAIMNIDRYTHLLYGRQTKKKKKKSMQTDRQNE